MTPQTTWAIDPNHSEVQFKVRHLMISNIAGTFKVFNGEVQTEHEDFSGATVHFEVDATSIDTNQTERDTHLKSPLFLDTQKFPKIIFQGTLEKAGAGLALNGQLTLCAVTKSISMPVEYTGTAQGRFADIRAGFEINGTINRKDYGLNFALSTDAGTIVVGEEIKLHFDIQLIQKPA